MASDGQAIQTAHNFNRQFTPSEQSGESGGLGFVDIIRSAERGGMVKSLDAVQNASTQTVADFSGDNPTMRRHGFSEAHSVDGGNAIMFAAVAKDMATEKDSIKLAADSSSFENVMVSANSGEGLMGDVRVQRQQQAA